ncbi:MAG TPA: potassium transporter Kup, partial [Polyangiales bacterium]|nr:potassium transporter Kup [Polyangiales bacterium]
PTPQNVLGILSLITWALVLVVSCKYLLLVMRADNEGEGGILALMALVLKQSSGASPGALGTAPTTSRALNVLILAGLFGASLLYGEGMITPAISVLGAIEGLEVATPVFKPWVVPITIVILLVLFSIQKRGTQGVARIFGPATLLWFFAIAAAGVPWIMRAPEVLAALNPARGLFFLLHHGRHGFLLLGSVVLCITGAEALTADMGHLGKRPIRWAWFAVVFPALLLNYYGQGAVLLAGHSEALANPFFALVSGVWIYPMIAIATLAAVVASQALITGAFSLTNQAVQLGYCPRLRVVHTSGHHEGQIYVPEVNSALMVACIGLVLAFQGSSALAAAYGIAVTGAMTVTSLLFFAIMRSRWGLLPALALVIAFLTVDLSFFSANLVKLRHGGWLPLLAAATVFTMFTTWKRGRRMLGDRLRASALPLEPFIVDLSTHPLTRVPGNAVFMSGNPDAVPPALLHHIKHNKSLHERVLLLSIITEHVPGVRRRERVECKELGAGLYHAIAHYGFMQAPRVPDVLRIVRRQLDVDMELANTSFYLGRETLISTGSSGMWRWRSSLFAFLSRNAHTATEFFGLPPGRVVELGMQVEL